MIEIRRSEKRRHVRRSISGSDDDDFCTILAEQVVVALWREHPVFDQQIRATLAAMMGMKPQDELEGMLIGQLIASHNAAMECYRRAMIGDQTFEGRRENLNQANKLSRTSAALTEALDRHRGKGRQRITVEHEIGKARNFFQRAIELDPRFAPAYAVIALTYLREAIRFRPDLRAENVPLALEHARHAVAIDPTDARAHATLASALLHSGRHAESPAEADLAVSLDGNSALAYGMQGLVRAWGGRPREAIAPLQTAIRLSPFDPLASSWLHYMARAHYWAEDYQAAIAVARQLRHSYPNFRIPYTTLIAAFGQMGQVDEARAVMAEARERFGEGFSNILSLPLSEMRELRPEDRDHVIDGFRKAGLVA
jgi:pentatricopeptide repeat protein